VEVTTERLILYDGDCGLCNAWVDFVLKQDKHKRFKFAPLQSEVAKVIDLDAAVNLKSIVYVRSGRKYSKSGAALRILRDLGGIWLITWIFWFIPFFIRDLIYVLIAKNRYRIFGKTTSCRIVNPEDQDRFLK
jgi:predicted DCC family thiol-disulfide oxidoreductase YuxK